MTECNPHFLLLLPPPKELAFHHFYSSLSCRPYPGSLLSLQPLHDQHGVHVLVVLLLFVLVALLGLLQPLLELPFQHQLPEAVAFFCRPLGFRLRNGEKFLVSRRLVITSRTTCRVSPGAPGSLCPAGRRCGAAAVSRPFRGRLSSRDQETGCRWSIAPPC